MTGGLLCLCVDAAPLEAVFPGNRVTGASPLAG